MTRPITYFDHAIVEAGFVMAALHGLLIRASYVGITGIVIELGGRIALTAIKSTFAHHQPQHHR